MLPSACRGVERGFQYWNFYGGWQLSMELPECNARPHYVHNTMYGGQAHLSPPQKDEFDKDYVSGTNKTPLIITLDMEIWLNFLER